MKRKSDQDDHDGCPEKRQKTEEEELESNEDLEDGRRRSKHNQNKKTQEDEPCWGWCCIQSVLRRDRRVLRGEPGGNLLKAGSHTKETFDVDFTGTDTRDHTTEFHVEKSDDKRANVLRYSSGSDNYYLKVKKSGEVNLRKLVHFPTDVKYYFHIKKTDHEYDSPCTIQSAKTKEYLHCSSDDKARAFMKEVNGVPEDRETWFCYIKLSSQTQNVDKFAQNRSGIDTVDFGMKNSEDAQEENLEDPELGSPKDPGKEMCDHPGRRNSKDPWDEGTPKDHDETHSEELKSRKQEDLAEVNSSGFVGKNYEEKKTSECKDNKQEKFEGTQKDNLEDPEGGSPGDPGKEKCDDPGGSDHDSKVPVGEKTPKDQEEMHSKELKKRKQEDSTEVNSNGFVGKNYEEGTQKDNLEDPEGGNPEDAGEEKCNEPGTRDPRDPEDEGTPKDQEETHSGHSE